MPGSAPEQAQEDPDVALGREDVSYSDDYRNQEAK
jgi:hypothetical protein